MSMQHIKLGNGLRSKSCLTKKAKSAVFSSRSINCLHLVLTLLFTSGCRHLLLESAINSAPLQHSQIIENFSYNDYQKDFLYLTKLVDHVIPLEPNGFSRIERATMRQAIIKRLGSADCDYATFTLCVQRYLAAIHSQHACIVYNPKPLHDLDVYPIQVHYVNDNLYLADISRSCDCSALGQQITAIASQQITNLEDELSTFRGTENAWTERTSLESPPSPYTVPRLYHFLGLIPSLTNSIELQFADHSALSISPVPLTTIDWCRPPTPPHPITARSKHLYDYQAFPHQHFAYLQFNACFDRIAILQGLQMVKPLYRPFVRLWLYLEFHRHHPSAILLGIYDPDRPVFKDFLASAIQNMHSSGITNLILDLRYNAGGETQLIKQLLFCFENGPHLHDFIPYEFKSDSLTYQNQTSLSRTCAELGGPSDGLSFDTNFEPMTATSYFFDVTNAKSPYRIPSNFPKYTGRIVVLVDQNTGSAASLLAGLLQDNRLATLVGTSSANNPTGITGTTLFQLPKFHILISLPTQHVRRARPSNGTILMPDYWVPVSLQDLQDGVDAAFNKAVELIGVTQQISAPATAEDVQAAMNLLKELHQSCKLPGWKEHRRGTLRFLRYSYFAPKTITFSLKKYGDISSYLYSVTKSSNADTWYLQKAQRVDSHCHSSVIYVAGVRNGASSGATNEP